MTLCPSCLARNIIAPKDGPTCSHRPAGSWWPEWWATADESQRISWLKNLQQPK